jgi:ABC-type branched-subunit amino acid transport system substrate-binding protein
MIRKARRLTQLACVLTATTLVAACGAGGREGEREDSAGSTIGITEDSIKIGGHFPLTGVAAPGYSEIPEGAEAYYKFLNANGGVNGRQIEWIAKDDGYNPTNTSSVVNELVLQEEVFGIVTGLGTPTHNAVVDFLNDEGVPDLFVASGALHWGDDPEAKPMSFGWQPDYEIEGKVAGKFIADNFPDAKVGLFLQDDDYGQFAEQGIRQFLDEQIVEVQRYTSGNTDVGPQIAALQASGADFVLGFNTPAYTALSQLVSMKLGYKPKWFYGSTGSDATLVGSLLERFSEGAVKGAGPLEGIYTTEYMPGDDDKDSPWTQLWEKIWAEHGNGKPFSSYHVYGMATAYTFTQAVQLAGDDISRERIVEVLEEGGADLVGPNFGPYRWSEESHLGMSGLKIAQVKGGVTEDVTGVMVTDIGDAEVTEDDAHAEDAPTESGIPEEEALD